MLEEINQPIEVVAIFSAKGGSLGGKENKLFPWKFLWKEKEYFIQKINLMYSSWEGRDKVYYFAVSDNTNYFKLKFNTDNLRWTLLESYVD